MNHLGRLLKENRIALLSILVLTALVFGNLLNAEHLQLDDPWILKYAKSHTILEAIKSGIFRNIYITVVGKFFGVTSKSYHAVSLFVHLVNVLLTYILASLITKKAKIAMLVTALFSLHPVVTESIGWISAYHYLWLFTVFAIVTILMLLFRKYNNKKHLYAAYILYAISLFGWRHPWYLVVPLVASYTDLFLTNRSFDKRELNRYLPYLFLILLYIPVVLIGKYGVSKDFFGAQESAFSLGGSVPLVHRYTYTTFMTSKLLLVPRDLSIMHEGENLTLFDVNFMKVSTLVLAIVTIYYLFMKKSKIAKYIPPIFLSTLLTYSPVAVSWFVAERYLYMSNFFFALFVVSALVSIEKKFKLTNLALYMVVVVSVVYGIRSYARTQDFMTDQKMWLATVKTAPNSERAYDNLGNSYVFQKDCKEAIKSYQKALDINPNYIGALHNIGYCYMELGELDVAREYLVRAVGLSPSFYQAFYKLALIEKHEGNFESALVYISKARSIAPNDLLIQKEYKVINQEAVKP